MLSFSLLGQAQLFQDEIPVKQFRSRKELALLFYLAHTGQEYSREQIAELLWEAKSTSRALSNLRTIIARIRKKLGDVFLTTRYTIALRPEHCQQVDSAILWQTITNIDHIDSPEKAHILQKTLESYQGDFLANFSVNDAPLYEAWITTTREQIRRQTVSAYEKLVHYTLTNGDSDKAVALLHRWLEIDEMDEVAHTLLIRLFIEQGDEQKALAQYSYLVRLLRANLDVAPAADLTKLIEGIQSKPAQPSPLHSVSTVQHNLPSVYDQFFGRNAVQQKIHACLDQPWCRLVTITGQGGAGKTRLAIMLARQRLEQYRDGVWFIELEEISPDDDELDETIAVEIATVLGLRLTGKGTPVQQLLNYLKHAQMLLVLDNFEHVLAGKRIVLEIVNHCEEVQLIVTSREPLHIRAEWVISLTGLSYPGSDVDEASSESVDLFLARRAQMQWVEVSPDELMAIRKICRMVEGLPLAIELAAALTSRFTCRKIADSLEDSFEMLATSFHDVPQRHRSLYMVFRMSWQALSPALKQVLAQLSVFHGGFTAVAAQEIVGANDEHLIALREKSLLLYDQTSNRYTLHPVIRAYAAEKRDPADPTPQKHTHYYLTLLSQYTEPLQKDKIQDVMKILEPEINNIRRAWQRGLNQHYSQLLYDALVSLSTYYQLRGLAREGEAVMRATMHTAKTWGDTGIPLATRAGLERVRFQNRLGQYRPAIQTIKETVKLAAQCADQWAEGMAHVWWGESLWKLGEYVQAKEKLHHALAIAEKIDDALIAGWSHHQLGIIHDIQSRYDQALEHLKKARAIWESLNNINNLSVTLNSLGIVHNHLDDLSAAKRELEQALALCNQTNNSHLQSFLLNSLSIIATEQGDYLGAQYYLQLGIELASTIGNREGVGHLYTNLGRNYRLLGEFDLSIASLEKGLQIARTLENQSLIGVVLLNLGNTKKDQGETEPAITFYNQALTIAQKNDLPSLECHVLVEMAELLSNKNAKQAQDYSSKAVTLAKSIQSPGLLKRAQALSNVLHTSKRE
ncbi:MAG: hypothetical protein D6706_13540 [Chloroflexi bacterium]|nr:MAG: hypothetical protein D6706_13540 [Chloroflexota bacterium]